MKKTFCSFFFLLLWITSTTVPAATLSGLDQVSVLMPKSQVLSILGPPSETVNLHGGLKVDVYRVVDALPLVRTGCIYDDDGLLIGQSLVFEGKMAVNIQERLKEHGFSLLTEQAGLARLAGRDDDTGRPLIAVIEEKEGLTTVTTFEKGFYDRRIK